MEQMLQALLGPKWIEWKAQLSASLQVDDEAAGGVLGGIAQQIMGRFTAGQLDMASLQQPGGVNELLGQLDLDAVASQAGVDTPKLTQGLAQIVPDLIASASSILGGGGGLSDVLGNLDLS
ncbi:MAG: hypothetical protein P1V35_16140 [Planctomycetota bacterium]|nr:hypothetical protein [Planctomycetota bacterium]